MFRSLFTSSCYSFFFNDTATTKIYTLSLHDALPIYKRGQQRVDDGVKNAKQSSFGEKRQGNGGAGKTRSEEHTSELQSHSDLVCRLLLEKKKKEKKIT